MNRAPYCITKPTEEQADIVVFMIVMKEASMERKLESFNLIAILRYQAWHIFFQATPTSFYSKTLYSVPPILLIIVLLHYKACLYENDQC